MAAAPAGTGSGIPREFRGEARCLSSARAGARSVSAANPLAGEGDGFLRLLAGGRAVRKAARRKRFGGSQSACADHS